MKLPSSGLSLDEKLREFDCWVTASIQEVQDTNKYEDELSNVSQLISSIGASTGGFSTLESCEPETIAATCVELVFSDLDQCDTPRIREKSDRAARIIESLASLLFMVTGKSDNNLKCQFPVYLTQNYDRHVFSQKSKSNSKTTFIEKPLGREIKSSRIARLLADALVYSKELSELSHLESEATMLLRTYIEAILSDKNSVKQLWALGRSYFALKDLGQGDESSLLAPIVIFKIRGSVSASGGHIPEARLRAMMEHWGMEPGVEFNLDDVVIGIDSNQVKSKTRAYDFVLPYEVDGREPEIFIQSQFYAGDSGSVSHKVVDQTKASRPLVKNKFPNARFIEYLDGAGYYSSLNTDLKHMLGMTTTKDFIQLRSATVKLRRELQEIGFLVPLEIEHAIIRSEKPSESDVEAILKADGYEKKEIDRCLESSLRRGLVEKSDGYLSLRPDRKEFARRIFLIDIVANVGSQSRGHESGAMHIPGYGDTFGLSIDLLSNQIDTLAPKFSYSRNEFSGDIKWLIEEKMIIIRN